jgi:hypothetical protein
MNRHDRRAGKSNDSAINITAAQALEQRQALMDRCADLVKQIYLKAAGTRHGRDGIICIIDPNDSVGAQICKQNKIAGNDIRVCVIERSDIAAVWQNINPDVAAGFADLEPGEPHVFCIAAGGATLQPGKLTITHASGAPAN